MLKKSYRFLFAALLAILFFSMAACSSSTPVIEPIATPQAEETAKLAPTATPAPVSSATPASCYKSALYARPNSNISTSYS